MNDIGGIPYCQVHFDKNGAPLDNFTLPPNLTDLFVISHGWNNDEVEAQNLYRGIFESFVAVSPPGGAAPRQFGILGIIWPSKSFDELVAVSGDAGGAAGAAGISGSNAKASEQAVADKLERMKQFFTEPGQIQAIDAAKAMIPELEDKGTVRDAFVSAIRSILDPSAANQEDASNTFFKSGGNDLMKNLKVADDDLDDELAAGGGASMPLGVGTVKVSGGAAGFSDFFHGFKAAAMNVLNFTTYYEMKRRAGIVGKNGVANLLNQLPPQIERIHLV